VKDKIKMQANEFFNTAGTDRNRQVVCADGFTMSVQAHQGAYCTPRLSGAPKYTHVEVGFPSEREDLLIQFAEEPDKPTQTVYGWVPVQTVTNVLPFPGGIVDGEVPFGVAPIPANFTADE
jgi:hypothetical protein